VRLACPARWLSRIERICAGRGRLSGARRARTYSVEPGARVALRFRLRPARLRALRRTGTLAVVARARNRDASGGTPAAIAFTITRP
jgi:hypothetical protein